jgi:phosphoglycerate dehydrogenase-like enzyme
MKIFILSPNKEAVFGEDLLKKVSEAGEVIFETEPRDFRSIQGLFDPEEKIIAADPDFFEWIFPNELLDTVPSIKAICLQTTSFSWVDTEYAAQKGIPVTNLRGFSMEAVAEYAFMMALSVARKLPLVIKDKDRQDFVKHQGIELRNKTAGIIGLGRIGRRIAEICEGFGMSVVYWSKNSREERWNYLELPELMISSDIVFPTLAQNKETENIITDDLLSSLSSSSIFISIVHKVYNHELLLNLAQEGKIYGYGFEEKDGDLNNYNGNVLALPSMAWATDESMKLNGRMWTESIVSASSGVYETKVN